MRRQGRGRRGWLRWTVLALFWLVQVAIAAWFVGYQISLKHPPAGGVDLRTPIAAWLLATLVLGAAVFATQPRGRDRNRRFVP